MCRDIYSIGNIKSTSSRLARTAQLWSGEWLEIFCQLCARAHDRRDGIRMGLFISLSIFGYWRNRVCWMHSIESKTAICVCVRAWVCERWVLNFYGYLVCVCMFSFILSCEANTKRSTTNICDIDKRYAALFHTANALGVCGLQFA